ncbi:unnamed protein product [Pedinophyceae sp. YPF-701]|nr:unnamed protein product [Pedinophyceae sp. YPF-701]
MGEGREDGRRRSPEGHDRERDGRRRDERERDDRGSRRRQLVSYADLDYDERGASREWRRSRSRSRDRERRRDDRDGDHRRRGTPPRRGGTRHSPERYRRRSRSDDRYRRSRSSSRERHRRRSHHRRSPSYDAAPRRRRSWSRSPSRGRRRHSDGPDWTCCACTQDNYDRSDVCRKCEAPRAAAAREPGSAAQPSNRVYMWRLPRQAGDAQIESAVRTSLPAECRAALERVRVVRDRAEESRGYGYLEFESIDAAIKAIETHKMEPLRVNEATLAMDYAVPIAYAPAPTDARSGGAAAYSDWMCTRCQCNNFARRDACFRCGAPRSGEPVPDNVDSSLMNEPSHVVRATGLAAETGEVVLLQWMRPYGVVDVRVICDKFTGRPRGFAYCEFGSVAEATRAINGLQGAVPPTQATPVRLHFARGKEAGVGGDAAPAAAAPRAHGAAGEAASGWQPLQFDESAALGAADAGGAADKAEKLEDDADVPGMTFDAASGYYHDHTTGMLYDKKSQCYFHAEQARWMRYNPTTTRYEWADTGEAVEAGGGAQAAAGAQAAPKKSGAVIGRGAQLDAGALLLHAGMGERRTGGKEKDKDKAAGAGHRADGSFAGQAGRAQGLGYARGEEAGQAAQGEQNKKTVAGGVVRMGRLRG